MRILFRADAGEGVGMGHISRSMVLAEHCRKAGDEVVVVVAEETGVRQFVGTADVFWMPAQCALSRRLELLAKCVRSFAPQWSLLDTYRDIESEAQVLKTCGKLLFLEDHIVHPEESDIVVNADPEAPKKHKNADPRLLLGNEYVLIREAFLSHEPKASVVLGAKIKLLITLGASDKNNLLEYVLMGIALCADELKNRLKVHIVTGSAYPHESRLKEQAPDMGCENKLYTALTPEKMAHLMHSCDMAVSAAGGTCYELAYLGIPSLIVSLGRHQEAHAENLDKHGLGKYIGGDRESLPDKLAAHLDWLVKDDVQRRRLNARGRSFIDGLGAQRIRSKMLERINE